MESGFLLEQFSRVCISPFLHFFLSFVAHTLLSFTPG